MLRFAPYAKSVVCTFAVALFADIVIVALIAAFVAIPLAALVAVVSLPFPIFGLAFFRDPLRKADTESLPDNILYAPADGKITEIAEINDHRVGGPALRIGIFLSIFDVHINRTPCACKVLAVERRPGTFLDARNPASSQHNAAADLTVEPQPTCLPDRIVVRQITGLIARRIICAAAANDTFTAGQQFGMIMFGSRTELIVPKNDTFNVLATLSQKVHAGNTPLIEYR